MRKQNNFYVADNATILGTILIGTDTNIWYQCVVRGDVASITLGDRVNLQDSTIVHTDQGKPIAIEDGVVAGHRTLLHCQRIGSNTLIGMGAILLSGAHIGEDCLIAAGSVVTEGSVIPPGKVVMGIPGKVVRDIRPAELLRTKEINQHYIRLAQAHANGEFPPPW